MQQVYIQGHGGKRGMWLVLAVVGVLALVQAPRALAQCCACQGCAAEGFCVDNVAGAVACATLCTAAGCPNLAFEDGGDCAEGCDSQPELPTATPSGTAAATVTDTPTHTPTQTKTPGLTQTPTGTAAGTATATRTHTLADTPTLTPTLPAGTATATVTATATSNPLATSTATPTLTPTMPSPNVVEVTVGTAVGQPGSVVGFGVTIAADRPLTTLQACLHYEAQTPINAKANNAPDCTAGESVTATFTFQPGGCTPGTTCTGVCADLSGAAEFPVSGTLFTCRVAISATAAVGNYPLGCTVDAHGTGPVTASCMDGEVIVQTNLPGDCNGDGIVSIDELIKGVNIALGNLPVTACPAFDTNHNGQVSIDELIAAVNVALTQ